METLYILHLRGDVLEYPLPYLDEDIFGDSSPSFLRGTVEPLPTFKRATEDAGPAEFRGVKNAYFPL